MRRTLEQVFLRRRSGRIEALLVIERESGGRERETLLLPSEDERAAASLLGRQLARRGRVDDVHDVRLRVDRAGSLQDEPELADLLVGAFLDELTVDDDDEEDASSRPDPWS
jgi:hypothetical protein